MKWKHTTLADVKEWHVWFAWYPVDGRDGHTYWLERVERRVRLPDLLLLVGFDWEYRPLKREEL